MRVEQLLTDSAARQPAATALITGKVRRSYGELDRMANRLAGRLVAHGIESGSRIVIFMDNGWEAAVALFGVLKAGGVVCPVDPATKSERLSLALNQSHAAGIITQARLAAVAGRAIAEASTVPLVTLVGADSSPAGFGCLRFEDAIRGGAEFVRKDAGGDTDPAVLDDTASEATTHADLVASVASLASDLGSIESDIVVTSMPLSDELGLRQMLAAVQVGAALVVDNEVAAPQAIFRKIGDEGATGIALSLSTMDGIAQTATALSGRFATLRYVAADLTGASPASVARIGELFPTARMVFTAMPRRRAVRPPAPILANAEARARVEALPDAATASVRIR